MKKVVLVSTDYLCYYINARLVRKICTHVYTGLSLYLKTTRGFAKYTEQLLLVLFNDQFLERFSHKKGKKLVSFHWYGLPIILIKLISIKKTNKIIFSNFKIKFNYV